MLYPAGRTGSCFFVMPAFFFQAGTVSSALTSSLDVLPTLTKLAGSSLPTDRYYDGEDMTALITGKAQSIRQVWSSYVSYL